MDYTCYFGHASHHVKKDKLFNRQIGKKLILSYSLMIQLLQSYDAT